MNAMISFRKEENKPPVFIFQRSDSSLTWSKLRNIPIEHDLAHYAVETVLRFEQGFYGLLDHGFTAEDFERPRAQRPQALLPVNLPLQAHQAEHIVGLIQTERLCGPNPNFIEEISCTLEARGIAYPDELTQQRLAEIRSVCKKVMDQWNALPFGQQLDLPFTLP